MQRQELEYNIVRRHSANGYVSASGIESITQLAEYLAFNQEAKVRILLDSLALITQLERVQVFET